MNAPSNVTQFPGSLRAPPHSLEAERAFLGAVLLNNRLLQRAGHLVAPGDFAIAAHGDLYERIVETVERGGVADVVTLKAWAESHPGINDLSDGRPCEYLATLLADGGLNINAHSYAEQIAEMGAKRRLIDALQESLDRAYDGATTARDLLDGHEQALTAISTGTLGIDQDSRTWAEVADAAALDWEAARKGETPPAVTTGLVDLDSILGGGLFPTDLILVAARPSMGKTALALRMATAGAMRFLDEGQGHHVLFFSMEQDGRQIVTRDVVGQTGIAMPAVRGGRLDDYDHKRLLDTMVKRRSLPILIDDRGGITVNDIARVTRRSYRTRGVRAVFIDYLGYMAFDDRYRGNMTQEISQVTKALKALAKELSIPVVLLAQLNRGVEARENKRPMLADLRDSGSIEQDADTVMFIYRDEYYLERQGEPTEAGCKDQDDLARKLAAHHSRLEACRGKAEIIIAKNRNGPCRTVHVGFDPVRMRFGDLERGLV